MNQRPDPNLYGPVVAEVLEVCGPMELGPGAPQHAAQRSLGNLRPEDLFPGRPLVDREMAECCLAGLWLRHNFLDRSHTISQAIGSPSGSYWHGLMHRREPDYANAKYWFRRVGLHPIFPRLMQQAREVPEDPPGAAEGGWMTGPEWDSLGFVDLCRQANEGKRGVEWCLQVAGIEWWLLFDFCFRQATGQGSAEPT